MQLSLDKSLPPGSDVKFKVKLLLDYYTEFSAAELSFRAPPALQALDTLDFVIKASPTIKEVENNSTTFHFSVVQKVSDVDGRIIIYLLRPQTGLGTIKVGRRIIFDTPVGSPVDDLDTKEGIITQINRNAKIGGQEAYKLIVNVSENTWNNLPSAQQSGLSSEHIIGFKNQTTVVRKKRYRFVLDSDIRNQLIHKDNVHDIMVFGYKQFNDGENASDVSRYYMIESGFTLNFDLDNPPPKSLADSHFINEAGEQKTNIPRTFDFNDGKNFVFFCTAVRYIQNKETGEWTGDWLQKNSRGRPVFAVNRRLTKE